jgi:hypothetical protein
MARRKKVKDPLTYYVSVINTVGDHYEAGYDSKWLSGMLKHWLPKVTTRVKTNTDVDLVKANIQDNAKAAIRDYCERLPDNSQSTWHKHDLIVCGLFDSTSKKEKINGLTPR